MIKFQEIITVVDANGLQLHQCIVPISRTPSAYWPYGFSRYKWRILMNQLYVAISCYIYLSIKISGRCKIV